MISSTNFKEDCTDFGLKKREEYLKCLRLKQK